MQTAEEVEKHVPVREGEYGDAVATVEPGGVEYIALRESHGAFGFLGNILPAGLNAFTGSIGWFIVNSVSGAFALQALALPINLNLPFWLTFLVIVVAQVAIATLGHNFIHFFERWALPLLGIVFAV